MTSSEDFSTCVIEFDAGAAEDEQLFLSVTPGFELGPPIQRDGVTEPRMTDPHTVPRVCAPHKLAARHDLPPTTDPWLQRAGSWTLYKHLQCFTEHNSGWTITGVQSNGDLTMNTWHVAYLGASHYHPDQHGEWCGLLTPGEPGEPFEHRRYRCFIKWDDVAAKAVGQRYDCLHVRFAPVPHGWSVVLDDDAGDPRLQELDPKLATIDGYAPGTRDIAGIVEFVLGGKPIVEANLELSMPSAVDRFDDVRHVFRLPEVEANGFAAGRPVTQVWFGERQLFQDLNVRRAALAGAILVPLDAPGGAVSMQWGAVERALKEQHFRLVAEAPTSPGQFREYEPGTVEVFFPHNVYPFSALGLRDLTHHPSHSPVVTLASGGLSGRVGNTLEGIKRIMFDHLGCADAMMLDEGADVFALANPRGEDGRCKYDNKEILATVLDFTRDRMKRDADKQGERPGHPLGMREWPLNKELFAEVQAACEEPGAGDRVRDDVIIVKPSRSQMRSVLIYARKDASTTGHGSVEHAQQVAAAAAARVMSAAGRAVHPGA